MSEAGLLGSAADLKFLHWTQQLRARNFKLKSGTAIMSFSSALIPKFA